jgi:hypothetical protein
MTQNRIRNGIITAADLDALTSDDEPSFADYCWGFYGPGGIYGDFFDNTLTRAELDAAIEHRMLTDYGAFAADSIDREFVRDIMLARRGLPTEYKVIA